MSLNTNQNSVMAGEMPTFTLPRDASGKEIDILTGKRDQHNYQLYQQQYKRIFGVYPELDKVNDPVCALDAVDGHIFLPSKLDKMIAESKKSGMKAITNSLLNVAGVGAIFDDANMDCVASFSKTQYYTAFRSEFEDALKKYKYAYSLILNLDFSYATNMQDCEYINDGLGYKKAGSRYYEGTWENGLCTYGMMWESEINYAFIGTFDENMLPDEGVAMIVCNSGYNLEAGLFTLVDFNQAENIGTLTARHGLRIIVDTSSETPIFMAAGGFENDEYNGTVYFYGVSNQGVAWFDKGDYDYGDEIKRDAGATTTTGSTATASSGKNRTVAILLCLFFGNLGAHHFYEGRTGKGILYLFTMGLLGIGTLVDLIKYLINKN